MTASRRWTGFFAAAVAICLLLAGCATHSYRMHPEADAKSRQIKKIVLAPPQVKAFEISAGGVPEQMDEWSAQAVANITTALSTRFAGTGMAIAVLKADGASEQEIKEVQSLFPAVAQSILTHTYPKDNPHYFPQKATRFEYSVGSVDALLKREGGDALLLVYGVDQFATSGKKALNVLGTITGVLASAFTGVAILPRGESTMLQMALADGEGNIIWYNVESGVSDLRDPSRCSAFVDTTLAAFPRLSK